VRQLSYADGVNLPEVCVCYLVRSSDDGWDILLGEKKTGLGTGKLVGPGGKLELGETPVQAVVREVLEEVGLSIDIASLKLIGELTYPFPHRPEWSQKSWAFVCDRWDGDPIESDELKPIWFRMDDIPFGRMWDDANFWLPRALRGEFVEATFTFGPDGNSVESTTFASNG
jgi:8-oxo-dGTP diphosphatase